MRVGKHLVLRQGWQVAPFALPLPPPAAPDALGSALLPVLASVLVNTRANRLLIPNYIKYREVLSAFLGKEAKSVF